MDGSQIRLTLQGPVRLQNAEQGVGRRDFGCSVEVHDASSSVARTSFQRHQASGSRFRRNSIWLSESTTRRSTLLLAESSSSRVNGLVRSGALQAGGSVRSNQP